MMKRYNSFPFFLALTLGFMGTGQVRVDAAPVRDDVAGIQMERDRRDMEREQAQEQIAEDEAARKTTVEQGDLPAAETAGSELHFELKRVEWNPSEILTPAEIQEITDAYVGRQITAKDLLEMTDKITALYRQKGYMTCGALLNRRIHDGVATIHLVEGRTDVVSVSGNNSTKAAYITNRLGLKAGEIANIAQLNRDLRWFHGTNDIQLRVVIKPGAKDGTTDYEIMAFEPQNQTVTLYMDNDGYENSGRWREGLFYTVRSLSGYRDALRTSFIRTQGTKAWALGYSFPLSRRGMRLDFNYSGNRTKVTSGELKNLGVRGKAQSFSLTWRVPFHMTARSRHEAGLQYVYQKSKTELESFAPPVVWTDDKINRVIPYVSFTHYGNSSVFYHKHSFVISKRDDASSGDSDSANLYRLSSFWQKRYGGGQFWQARLEGQWSSNDDYMASSDRFFIGGVNTVRGYEEGFIGGMGGLTANLEYHIPLDKAKHWSLFPFFDWGKINGEVGMEHKTLMSTGLGIEARYKNIYSTLTVGFPLKKDFYGKRVDSTRIDFSLSATF